MHLKEMSHELWIWREWEKARYGLTGRVLEDTGLHLLMVIATGAVMLEVSNLQSVKQVVANPHNDSKYTHRERYQLKDCSIQVGIHI